jgi:hypothetical protein
MSPWSNFIVVICAQLVIFLFLAYKKKATLKIRPRIVLKSIAVGTVFGIAFDVVVGKYLGIFNYVLHFDPLFLIINGALSYGLWILTIQLLQSERFISFCTWSIGIGLVYEIVNYFYPVWIWTFGGSFLYQESLVIFIAYCGLAILAALTASFTMKTPFKAFALK